MEIRHNTTLLEQAIAHIVRQASIPSIEAEARAQETMARAQALRRIATGAALGVAAVGIGLGIWLAYPNVQRVADVMPSAEKSTPPDAPAPAPGITSPNPAIEPAPESPAPADVANPPTTNAPANPDIVTTDYSIFNNRTVPLAGQNWDITAGHFFENETDQQWKQAWCYSEVLRDGVVIKIDLALREGHSTQPMAPTASPQTLEKAGLTTLEALTLATRCPWLDKKEYTVRDFTSTPGQGNPFQPDETSYTLSGTTLIAEGSIGDDFLEKIRSHQFDVLQINSPGGSVDVAIETGAWLREKGKTVQVASNCLSACVFVLAGGVSRIADPSAHIGVHRFYNVGPETTSDTEIAQELSSRILRHFERMGVDAELFHVMANTPASDMFYIDREKLISWRLLSPLEVGAPDISQSTEPTAMRERFLMSSSSVWLHQGSVVGLSRDGSKRTLRLLHTATALTGTTASRGSLLFDGTTPNGVDYEGTAYAHHICGSKPFSVVGNLSPDGKSMTLLGQGNEVDEQCFPIGQKDIELRLELVGLSTSPTLFANLAAKGINLPNGLKDPDPVPITDIDGFVLTYNTDFPGGDFETLKGTALEQCARVCASEARCKGFTYNSSVQWCFLKSDIGTPVAMQNSITGRRQR
jgi:hypothetical protein